MRATARHELQLSQHPAADLTPEFPRSQTRDNWRFRQGLQASKLLHYNTLDEYDFDFQPELDAHKSPNCADSPHNRVTTTCSTI